MANPGGTWPHGYDCIMKAPSLCQGPTTFGIVPTFPLLTAFPAEDRLFSWLWAFPSSLWLTSLVADRYRPTKTICTLQLQLKGNRRQCKIFVLAAYGSNTSQHCVDKPRVVIYELSFNHGPIKNFYSILVKLLLWYHVLITSIKIWTNHSIVWENSRLPRKLSKIPKNFARKPSCAPSIAWSHLHIKRHPLSCESAKVWPSLNGKSKNLY